MCSCNGCGVCEGRYSRGFGVVTLANLYINRIVLNRWTDRHVSNTKKPWKYWMGPVVEEMVLDDKEEHATTKRKTERSWIKSSQEGEFTTDCRNIVNVMVVIFYFVFFKGNEPYNIYLTFSYFPRSCFNRCLVVSVLCGGHRWSTIFRTLHRCL